MTRIEAHVLTEENTDRIGSDSLSPIPYERVIRQEPQTVTTEEFFKALFDGVSGYLSIWDRQTKQTRWFSTTELKEAVQLSEEMIKAGHDVYFGVGLQSQSYEVNIRGKAETISVIPGTWADIDIAGIHSAENLPKTMEEARSIIAGFPFPPTIIVHSGGGLHVYWLFDRPWLLTDPKDNEQAKRLSKRFQEFLRDEAGKQGWKLDPTADLARLLRVPGTVNYKDADNPKPVKIIVWDLKNRYRPEIIKEYLDKVMPAETSSGHADLSYPGTASDIVANCAFVQHCRDDQRNLSEPDWHGMITILNKVPGGRELIHEFSDTCYPGATPERTDQKIEEASRAGLPCNCDYIRKELGFACPAEGCGVKGPISFASNHAVVARLRIKELTPEILLDSRVAFEPNVLNWLLILKEHDPSEYAKFKTIVKGKVNHNDLESCISDYKHKAEKQGLINDSAYFRDFNQTDHGNAQRLLKFAGNQLRYCHQNKKWYIWADTHWQEDDCQDVKLKAIKSVEHTIDLVKAELQGDKQKEILKWCQKSQSNAAIKAMVEMSQFMENIPVKKDAFDSNPYLLNCLNGTLDLRTGELHDHCQDDLISKCIATYYDSEAQCPTWTAFIHQAMGGDQDAIAYLQMAVGITLTGALLKKFFFVYGPSNTGKSRFIEAINYLLGDYSLGLAMDILMSTKFDTGRGPSPELVRLIGARAVITSETTDGKRLDGALVKRITGGDTLAVRGLYSEPIEFIPYFKLWIHGNYKPDIQGDDSGIWNRLVLIPFNNIIEPENQDPDLLNKFKAELPGILAWAMQGCFKWINNDEILPEPPELFAREAADYQESMDYMGQFIKDCCIQEEGQNVPVGDLYKAFCNWSLKNGRKPISNQKLKTRLEERGYKQDRNRNIRYWKGLSLNPEAIRDSADFVNWMNSSAANTIASPQISLEDI
ncbi:MAG: phage/plasmid primase, P4 family [Deltaproteobacteria bacterium]